MTGSYFLNHHHSLFLCLFQFFCYTDNLNIYKVISEIPLTEVGKYYPVSYRNKLNHRGCMTWPKYHWTPVTVERTHCIYCYREVVFCGIFKYAFVPTLIFCMECSCSVFQQSLRSRKAVCSYDIDNVVIPMSMTAATRVEKPQYKEIVVPRYLQTRPWSSLLWVTGRNGFSWPEWALFLSME